LVSEVPKYLYSYECEQCGEMNTKDFTPLFRMFNRVGVSFLVKDPVYDP